MTQRTPCAPHALHVALAFVALALSLQAAAQQPGTTAQRVVTSQQQAAQQQATQQQATPSNLPSPNTAARFVQSCNDSLERGVSDLGCQAPIYRNELERLKREAVSTNNPQLFSLVGQAYGNPRNGLGDLGQSYRWYLLAAVRGDPIALKRLSDLNRAGQGVPQDNVKALGYARLADRLSIPGSGEQRNAARVINQLGDEMALEEVALAESFANQLQAQIQHHTGQQPLGAQPPSADVPRSAGAVPGMAPTGAQPSGTPPFTGLGAAPTPGTVLPGVPAVLAPASAPIQ